MKKIMNRLINIILFLLMGILLVVTSLEKFCVENWDDLKLQTIIRQLQLSISGTDKTLVIRYFKGYFVYVAVIFCVVLAVFLFFHIYGRKLNVTGRVFDRRIKANLYAKYSKNAIIIIIITIPFFIFYGTKLGVFTYIDNRINPSTIFEEYYVDARDVNIEFPKEKKNLILIYAESMETGYSSREEGGAFDNNYIPNLTELAKENVNISGTDKLGGGFDTEGTSDFTVAALMASLGGVPYLSNTGNDANIYGKIMPGLCNFGDILNENGYHNYFQCGSDASFGSRSAFFEQHGNYTILDYVFSLNKGEIPEGYHNDFWGYEDKYLFDIAKKNLTRIASEDEPFNYTMLTVDTHFPAGYKCDLCEEQWSDYYANSISCSDRQIVDFVNWCKEQPWFDNTTLIIVGDHTTMTEGYIPEGYARVTYNCFIGLDDSVNVSHIKYRNFTTMDYFPTFLSSINVKIDGDRLALGTNLFSDKDTIIEEMGYDRYMNQINRFSNFYHKNIDMR